jgi:type III pantothenate kinase
MLLLLDIGNTHTHIGVGDRERVLRQTNIRTQTWFQDDIEKQLAAIVPGGTLRGAALCSVVPKATPRAVEAVKKLYALDCLELNFQTIQGIGLDYPRPETIGPDRLANSVACKHHHGSPSLVVDFGTAVTFDIIDARGCYSGGIIAPGLSVMTTYLHEKTALLPRIDIREVSTVIGKSTEEAMLIGAVHGYRGLIKELILQLKKELKVPNLPVIATGGYARLIAAKLPEIAVVDPFLTLEGLRLEWQDWERRHPPALAAAQSH